MNGSSFNIFNMTMASLLSKGLTDSDARNNAMLMGGMMGKNPVSIFALKRTVDDAEAKEVVQKKQNKTIEDHEELIREGDRIINEIGITIKEAAALSDLDSVKEKLGTILGPITIKKLKKVRILDVESSGVAGASRAGGTVGVRRVAAAPRGDDSDGHLKKRLELAMERARRETERARDASEALFTREEELAEATTELEMSKKDKADRIKNVKSAIERLKLPETPAAPDGLNEGIKGLVTEALEANSTEVRKVVDAFTEDVLGYLNE